MQGLCTAAQIFYSLSERHTHLEFRPSDLHGMHASLKETLFLVMEHAEDLPRLHRQQANQGDTASLVVSLSSGLLGTGPKRTGHPILW